MPIKCKTCKTELIYGNRCIDCFLANKSFDDKVNLLKENHLDPDIAKYCIKYSRSVENQYIDVIGTAPILTHQIAKISCSVKDDMYVIFLNVVEQHKNFTIVSTTYSSDGDNEYCYYDVEMYETI